MEEKRLIYSKPPLIYSSAVIQLHTTNHALADYSNPIRTTVCTNEWDNDRQRVFIIWLGFVSVFVFVESAFLCHARNIYLREQISNERRNHVTISKSPKKQSKKNCSKQPHMLQASIWQNGKSRLWLRPQRERHFDKCKWARMCRFLLFLLFSENVTHISL